MESQKTSGDVTVKDALRKGVRLLVLTPILIMILLFGLAGFGLGYKPAYAGVLVAVGFVGGIAGAWLWWSFKVVKWKIWAYQNVRDIHKLEREAIRRQLIHPRGSFFERTEIRTGQDNMILQQLETRFDKAPVKEIVIDPSLPPEVIIKPSPVMLVIYAIAAAGGLYFLSAERWIIGIMLTGFGTYLAIGSFRKLKNDKYVIRINEKGISLGEGPFHLWNTVNETYLSGSKSVQLNLTGEDFYEGIELDDFLTSPDELLRKIEVYRTRSEKT